MREITSENLVRRLSALCPLGEDEARFVEEMVRPGAPHAAGSVLLQQGEQVLGPRVLTSGWAWRTRTLPTGRRQVFALVLPGDLIGLCWRPSPRALSSTVAVTSVQTCDASALIETMTSRGAVNPALWEALTLVSRHDEMRLLDHVVRLGQQTAVERLATLMLEVHDRLGAVGLAEAGVFDMPLSHEQLASMLGLSLVHVNRTLQQLRQEGLADIRSGKAVLLNPERMRSLSSYEASARSYAEAV